MPDLARRPAGIAESQTVGIADLATSLRRQGLPVIDMSAGRAAEHTPAYISEAAAAALAAGDTHQTPARGTVAFRQACAAKLLRDSGITCDPETEIIATMGVKQALTLSLMATIDPGDEVIVEDPCFVSYEALIELAGGTAARVPLLAEHGFRWRQAQLEAAVTPRTRAILFNSPHNPTGVVHDASDLDAIAEVAARHDLWVITDEVYERVTWAGRRHLPIVTRPGMRERTVTIVGLSKSFAMGGWRVAFVFAPARVMPGLVKLQQHLITCATSFVQAGAARALAEPPPPELLALWSDWEARCNFLCDALAEVPGVRCRRPEGGFYAWADIRELSRDSAAVADYLLRQHHVAVVPGVAFGPAGEGYLRITCVRSWSDVREGLARLQAAFATLARTPQGVA